MSLFPSPEYYLQLLPINNGLLVLIKVMVNNAIITHLLDKIIANLQ